MTRVEPATPQDGAKRAAGRAAVEAYVRDGMRVGLGSGSTAHWFVRALAERVASGLDVVGVVTSTATRDLARQLDIPLADLNDVEELDVDVDGADEIDGEGAMIKGGGGALLWEKIVAGAARRMVAVVDEAKVVDRLGAFPLPVEVVPFGWRSTALRLREAAKEIGLDDVPVHRRPAGAEPFVTDSGHYVLDVHLGTRADVRELAPRLTLIPGVVEHGLFVGVADAVAVGRADGSTAITDF